MIHNCPKEDILSAFLDQGLSVARMNRVRKHLQVCENCRCRLSDLTRQYEQMDSMIRNLPEVSASPGFDAAFWRKVEGLKQASSRPNWFERFFHGWRPVLAAGAAAALVASFVIFRINHPVPSAKEIFIVEHMEMLSEIELIEHLDLLENWEAVQAMKEQG